MNKKEEREVDDIVHIDKTRLDDAAENQPYLVWEYGKGYAKAIKHLDEARAALKVTEAEVDISVRENPDDFDLPSDKKPSEAAIRAAVLRSKEYEIAGQAVIDAQYRVNMFEAACKQLDHKRTSITILDGQDERGYFARPKQKQRNNTGDEFGHRKKMMDKKKYKY